MACDVCSNAGGWETGGQRLSRFVSPADLKEGATRCAECALIWAALEPLKTKWHGRDLAATAELQIATGNALQVRWPRGSIALELFTRDDDIGPRHPCIGPVSEVSARSDSDASFELAAAWLRDCMANHDQCRAKTPPATLPTRVIDVGVEGGREPFLVVTSGRREEHASDAYAALTYCWGDPSRHHVLKTTRDNFDAHRDAIPLHDLPGTLRDTVVICRRLGLQYLWIDALCIVQGDAQDWAREAGRMCDVYSNATLTIAADHADGTSAGIFRPQQYGETPPRLVSRDGARPVYVRPLQRHNDVTMLTRSPDPDEDALAPINQRAWTLQEAVLSNRMLHYTADEMLWRCNALHACECRRGAPRAIGDLPETVFRNVGLFGRATPPEAYTEWRNLLVSFSERLLSVDADKLSALSGMAQQFSRMRAAAGLEIADDRYLAGLWADDLPQALMWSVDYGSFLARERGRFFRMPKWRAPSWSWAAVEAPIKSNSMSSFRSAVTLIEATVELTDEEDPFGRVREAKITLAGRMVHGLGVKITAPTFVHDDLLNVADYEIIDPAGQLWSVVFDNPSAVRSDTREYSCFLVGTAFVRGAISTNYAFLVLKMLDMFENCPEESITII
ncbi:heterokaryon incompatibility protein-domain-containing protein [Lasiosphaeria miniovina]|uniref:Heterokaryon incompatibility protein-domain-containing protein n=1 Tax=Lasiosphaeria miniovina TaxID=1954250 RepID=A0AA40ATP1_9PEZI|nr:heterokaryon incompatibility protein-domain-containing protein [Lasiosphaeria miniovina]KAK0721828.1 heterokaryon incompatibility protein-domain-containing protein [Lasiosphaeria miniovina]